MCLGALMDVGVPLDYLQDQLSRLGLGQAFQLRSHAVHRQGQRALQALVEFPPAVPDTNSSHATSHVHTSELAPTHAQPHRHLGEIERLIRQANLPPRATTWSLDVFQQLAIAEGTVHGMDPQQVHFHEVGAVDAIVDIVGTCLGLDWLGIDQLYCSAMPTGGGTVKATHGQLPVPVPAVLQLWQQRQVPIYDNGIQRELVTPTGAAIAITLAHRFGPPPPMQLQQVGLGAGARDLALPNVLRLWVGKSTETPVNTESSLETLVVLETQIDDLNPQAIGYTFEQLFAAGAMDVFTQAIGMKKSRPGILLTIICPLGAVEACETVVFQETSTLGIRRCHQQRTILPRNLQPVETLYGSVQVKVAWHQQEIVNVQPEYEDCARLARQHQVPWRQIQQLARQTWYNQWEQSQPHPPQKGHLPND